MSSSPPERLPVPEQEENQGDNYAPESTPHPQPDDATREPASIPTDVRGDAAPQNEAHRCFICLVDEPEASLPSDWVTPCTCTLEGHQDCLLVWITDLESREKEVKCPMCKSQITVLDRWDPAVHLSDALSRRLSGLSPLFLLTCLSAGGLLNSAAYGFHALEVFAGPEVAFRYVTKLSPVGVVGLVDWTDMDRGVVTILGEPSHNVDILHFLSLTLVGPALIINRTHWAEILIFPSSLMYVLFLNDHRTEALEWPPSLPQALAVVSVVKALYLQLYTFVSSQLDKRLEAVTTQTRNLQGETIDRPAIEQEMHAEAQDDNRLMDIHIELELGAGNNADNDAQAQPQNDPAPAAAPVRQPRRPNAASIFINRVAGALLWPSVSFGVGSLLTLLLPKRWVTKPFGRPSTGLLQERWGRSLVGGCLFVVLKDAFYLYVKYRSAINRPYRTIQNTARRNRPS